MTLLLSGLSLTGNVMAQVDEGVANRLTPPEGVEAFYESSPNTQISDDFNGSSVDFTRWAYRNGNKALDWGTDENSVYIESDADHSWVTLKGIKQTVNVGGEIEEGLGSGIVSKNTSQYGFYILKWRMKGASYESGGGSGWHPAVWGSRCNFSYSPQGECISGLTNRLELDILEGFEHPNSTYWTSHLFEWGPAAAPADRIKHLLTDGKVFDWPTTEWKIIGYEYSPEYIRLWEYNQGVWGIAQTYMFTSNPSVEDVRLNDQFRSPVYWILSNKVSNNLDIPVNGDSWFQIDYFYHYDYLDNIYTENNVVNEGVYNLENNSNSLYLHDFDSSNPFVTQNDLLSDCAAQRWKFIENGDGTYKIQNILSREYLKSHSPEANVRMQANADSNDQNWFVMTTPEGGGGYYLKSLTNDNFLRGTNPGVTYTTINEIIPKVNNFWWQLQPVDPNNPPSDNSPECYDGIISSIDLWEETNLKLKLIRSDFSIEAINGDIIDTVQMFGLNGRLIHQESNVNGSAYHKKLAITEGVYILRVVMQSGRAHANKILLR
jgi:hypothetical protein